MKHFFSAPDINDAGFPDWFRKLKSKDIANSKSGVKVVYQTEEHGYQARSFEDAFFNSNKSELKTLSKNSELLGLKNKADLEEIETSEIFELTDRVLDKKSDFAASVLYLALIGKANWVSPEYIKEGLRWISQ